MKDDLILDKLSCFGMDLRSELNGDIARYKKARSELERIDSVQAELWSAMVRKFRELDRIDKRLWDRGCVSSVFFDEHPDFTGDMRSALTKSGVEGFGTGSGESDGGAPTTTTPSPSPTAPRRPR